MMHTINMESLINKLNEACHAYYDLDSPIMTDREYDELYDTLENLEKYTGIVMSNSPTQRVQGSVLDSLEKVTHSKPMLSAQKTKDIKVISKYLGNKEWYCSYKLDGLTIVLRYDNGKLQQAITRGNGTIGEDVTAQAKMITNIPLVIPYDGYLEIRGECVVDWETFNMINFDKKFSHPRNYAAGSIRQLDTNITRDRKLKFLAFEVVTAFSDDKLSDLNKLVDYGFDIVSFCGCHTAKEAMYTMSPDGYKYPVDGLIFELRSRAVSNSMDNTSHHEGCRYALKWKDDIYDTKLIDVDFTIGKTGVLSPTAVFETVWIDGDIERASLHNISVMKELLGTPYKGQEIGIYKANMIIPQVAYGNKDTDWWNEISIPDKCPYCGAKTEIVKENDSEELMCTNKNCSGRLVKLIAHAVSRDALNIDGLSEATIQYAVDRGWVGNFKDIYNLKQYAERWASHSGFGKKSIDKLMESIDKSRKTNLARFIYSLSIPLVGQSASKEIAKICKGNYEYFITHLAEVRNKLINTPGYGSAIGYSMKEYFNDNKDMVVEFAKEFDFDAGEFMNKPIDSKIKDKTFVCTGSVNMFKSRKELEKYITDRGGKLSGAVSKATFALINNDTESASSKNKKAKELGIPIWSENDFMEFCNK